MNLVGGTRVEVGCGMRWRIVRSLFLGILLLLLTGGGMIIWKASTELISPARRSLLPYHLDWLERPLEHGMSIQRFSAMEGQVPCLLVLPDASAGLSKRGE